jgi:putative FmdB family regulatory protein
MPIYAYRCAACGHSKDVLQKMSDPVLTACPNCGADAFQKQVTAAGFQLKGSGWYVTDFRGGAKPNGEGDSSGDKKPGAAAPAEAKNGDGTPAPAAKTDSPAAAPAASPPPASPPAVDAK